MVNLGKTITRVVGHPLGKNRPDQSIVESKTIVVVDHPLGKKHLGYSSLCSKTVQLWSKPSSGYWLSLRVKDHIGLLVSFSSRASVVVPRLFETFQLLRNRLVIKVICPSRKPSHRVCWSSGFNRKPSRSPLSGDPSAVRVKNVLHTSISYGFSLRVAGQ